MNLPDQHTPHTKDQLTEADVERYAPKLSLIRHTGLLLWWFQQEYGYRGSPEKLQPEVVSVTVKNLFFGWWSPMSLIINPVVTIANWVNFAKYKTEFGRFAAQPHQYLLDARAAEHHKSKRLDRNFKRALVVLGILVALFIVFMVSLSLR